jgi:hypothetical protein
MNTFVNQGLWLISGLSLFVVAWVRFNKPPTNRAGTTFLLFYSGMVFYYALLVGLWLLVILLLTGSGYGLSKIGGAVASSLKDHQELSPSVLAVLAEREGVSRSYFTRVVRLSYLAPDITQAILDGHQPRDLTAEKLLAHSRLPLAWHDQRTVLGFACA